VLVVLEGVVRGGCGALTGCCREANNRDGEGVWEGGGGGGGRGRLWVAVVDGG